MYGHVLMFSKHVVMYSCFQIMYGNVLIFVTGKPLNSLWRSGWETDEVQNAAQRDFFLSAIDLGVQMDVSLNPKS